MDIIITPVSVRIWYGCLMGGPQIAAAQAREMLELSPI